jgi:hypothetical protein
MFYFSGCRWGVILDTGVMMISNSLNKCNQNYVVGNVIKKTNVRVIVTSINLCILKYHLIYTCNIRSGILWNI